MEKNHSMLLADFDFYLEFFNTQIICYCHQAFITEPSKNIVWYVARQLEGFSLFLKVWGTRRYIWTLLESGYDFMQIFACRHCQWMKNPQAWFNWVAENWAKLLFSLWFPGLHWSVHSGRRAYNWPPIYFVGATRSRKICRRIHEWICSGMRLYFVCVK